MFAIFARSLSCHLRWWIASFWPGRHSGAPLSFWRLCFLLLAYPLFLLLQLIHWVGFCCDALCFPGYRKVIIREPLFVLGIPRSGTTFLHRTLAADTVRFTSFNTWEAILAPSISQRRVIQGLAALDRHLGCPLKRLLDGLLRAATGDFNDIHAVDLNGAEEDYLALLPAGACFILLLAFPFAPELRRLANFSAVPDKSGSELLAFYKSLLQRHLYCHPGKQLLSKNAAFSTWGPALQAAFPDAKFLVCVREPTSALSSQLSAVAPARRLFSTDPDGSATAAIFAEIYASSYPALSAFIETCSPGQAALIAQGDLRARPAATIRAAMAQLGLACDGLLGDRLAALPATPPSPHRHRPDGLETDSAQFRDCMQVHYETMLRSNNRVAPAGLDGPADP